MPTASTGIQYSVNNIPALTYVFIIVATVSLGVIIGMNDMDVTPPPPSLAAEPVSNTLNSVAGTISNSVGDAISSVTGTNERTFGGNRRSKGDSSSRSFSKRTSRWSTGLFEKQTNKTKKRRT